jgi:hypothetical protein
VKWVHPARRTLASSSKSTIFVSKQIEKAIYTVEWGGGK